MQSQENTFYLSAFLCAWRSVIDILLYDIAEYYELYDFRNRWRTTEFNSNVAFARHISKIANKRGNHQAEEFIEWWFRNLINVWNSKLSEMRKQVVHEGGLQLPKFARGIPLGHFSLRNYIYAKEITPTIDECQKGFSLVENIVDEAEVKLKIRLT